MHRILVLSGPNLQLLGSRQPEIYGSMTLEQIHQKLITLAEQRGAAVECRQSNHEGDLLDWLGYARSNFHGVLINPGALTHTSYALRDAIATIELPCVEVHISNPESREVFRHRSRIASVCIGKITGFGPSSYSVALNALLDWLLDRAQH